MNSIQRNVVLASLLLLSCVIGLTSKKDDGRLRQNNYSGRWWRKHAVMGRKKGWKVPDEWEHC